MPRIWLIGGATFVGVLLIASIVVALVQTEATFPAGGPEEAVQDFLRAHKEKDFRTTYGMLSEKLREDCSFDEYAEEVVGRDTGLKDNRVAVKETEQIGEDKVIVVVRVTRISSDGPFQTSDRSHQQRFTLGREEGEWRFTASPWPTYGCSKAARPTPTPATDPPSTTTPRGPRAPRSALTETENAA